VTKATITTKKMDGSRLIRMGNSSKSATCDDFAPTLRGLIYRYLVYEPLLKLTSPKLV